MSTFRTRRRGGEEVRRRGGGYPFRASSQPLLNRRQTRNMENSPLGLTGPYLSAAARAEQEVGVHHRRERYRVVPTLPRAEGPGAVNRGTLTPPNTHPHTQPLHVSLRWGEAHPLAVVLMGTEG